MIREKDNPLYIAIQAFFDNGASQSDAKVFYCDNSTLLFNAEQVESFVTVQQFIAVKVQMLLEENIESQVIRKWLFIIAHYSAFLRSYLGKQNSRSHSFGVKFFFRISGLGSQSEK